ncbi:MAG: sigma-70 family RNA polymerase sigma factor, partial [Planctomycetaceae bacterium]
MKSRYQHPAIRQLADQQVRYAPLDIQVEQMDQAERLLHELEPESRYRYVDLCERITGYRPDRYPDLVVEGQEAIHDLRLFVEDLSQAASLPVERAPEPVFTVDDLSERFQVSTKTVDRWRKRGLVSRRFKFGNRTRVGFLRSSVDRFVNEHEDEVLRGGKFTQLNDSEREELLRKARRLALFGANRSEVARQLAETTGRSAETVRYTIKQYDEEHPENAIFPKMTAPLTPARRREIYQRLQRGASIDDVAEEYGRTKSSIYRIQTEVRAAGLFEQPIDFMDSPEFHTADAASVILADPPVIEKKQGRLKPPPGLPPYLASLYAISLLTREEEQYWFRKFNFLKFQAAQLRNSMDPRKAKAADIDELDRLLQEANNVKSFLIRSNLRLVVSIAKRHLTPQANFFEMVSDGNMSLIRAIEKFDYTKGNKFSTYATWAIMKNYARSIPAEHRVMDRFRTGNDEVFQSSHDDRSNGFAEERANVHQHQALMAILGQLEDREREILLDRYGLEKGRQPQTLEQVGSHFGVTKERIRQIESRAL